MGKLVLEALTTIPEIHAGDNLADQLISAMDREDIIPVEGDILVVAHKVVSKAEGRQFILDDIVPGNKAEQLAALTGKPASLVQLVLNESTEILVAKRGVLMCRSRLGWICANAGVDQSNSFPLCAIAPPLDPDHSAKEISSKLYARFAVHLPVVISDTHGRPLREGIIGIALGSWGIDPIRSYINKQDRFGRKMNSSIEAIADELASAAGLLMGQGDEGIPAVLIRGFPTIYTACGSLSLHRSPERELFLPRLDQKEVGK